MITFDGTNYSPEERIAAHAIWNIVKDMDPGDALDVLLHISVSVYYEKLPPHLAVKYSREHAKLSVEGVQAAIESKPALEPDLTEQ
jgi:hypothetical protein